VLAIPMHGLPEVGEVAPEAAGRTKARSHEVCHAIDLTILRSLTVTAQGRSQVPAKHVPQARVLAIPMHGLPEVGVVAPEPVGRTKARSHEVCLAIDLTIQKSLTVTAQGRSRVPAKRVPQTFAVPAVYAAVPMV